MTREHDGRRPSQAQASGILSGMFSFVSREIESFVTSAAGGSAEVSLCTLSYIFIFYENLNLTRLDGQVRDVSRPGSLHKRPESERVSRQSEAGARPRSACEDRAHPHSEYPDNRNDLSSSHCSISKDGM